MKRKNSHLTITLNKRNKSDPCDTNHFALHCTMISVRESRYQCKNALKECKLGKLYELFAIHNKMISSLLHQQPLLNSFKCPYKSVQ